MRLMPTLACAACSSASATRTSACALSISCFDSQRSPARKRDSCVSAACARARVRASSESRWRSCGIRHVHRRERLAAIELQQRVAGLDTLTGANEHLLDAARCDRRELGGAGRDHHADPALRRRGFDSCARRGLGVPRQRRAPAASPARAEAAPARSPHSHRHARTRNQYSI